MSKLEQLLTQIAQNKLGIETLKPAARTASTSTM